MISPDESVTTTALLERLFIQEDSSAWRLFDKRLRPVLLGTARRMGVGEADAQEVVQDCLVRVVGTYREGGYARTGGRLRSWILAILRNRVRDLFRRRALEPGLHTESVLGTIPAQEQFDHIWSEEARRQLGRDVLDLLRRCGEFDERTILAFEQHVLFDRDAKEVAKEIGVSVWAVYKARQRCSARFREVADELSTLYGFLDA